MLAFCVLLSAVRPFPEPIREPLGPGVFRYVDAAKGDDAAEGSERAPWKTLVRSTPRLKPGETLVLRGGVYHEHLTLKAEGKPGAPITLRAYPGEWPVIDGGLPEFLREPAKAWEPVAGGTYRSAMAYPGLAGGRRGVAVLGNFASDLVPLHGYRFRSDFHSANPYWNLTNKVADDPKGIYCGPGLWYDEKTERLHARLAPVGLKVLGKDDYAGKADPREVPLIVAGEKSPLTLMGCKHLVLRGLGVRGSAAATLVLDGCDHVTLDEMHVLGGSPAVSIRATTHLKLLRSVVRGLTAPWSSRASHKYRGNSAYLLTVRGDKPSCSDFEFAHCEFTDSHDGLIVGTVDRLTLRHNFLDNFDDDGLYLTLQRAKPPEGMRIYQNHFGRCLTWFAHAQSGKGVKNEVGPGVFVCRNVFDLRRGVATWPPTDAKEDVPGAACWDTPSRLGGDHGSPVWEPMFFYHNTVLLSGPPFRGVYAGELGGHTANTTRRVFNNAFVTMSGEPGRQFPTPDDDFAADGNLHWSHGEGAKWKDPFGKWRGSVAFAASKRRYTPGWGAADVVADPRFEGPEKGDVRLRADSPARGAGVTIPADWFDPLPAKGRPDIGALPYGAARWRVGPRR